jgi:2-phosphoglycerate kinase
VIYLIGGAPRAEKSILCQQIASRQNIGWISTDLLMELLKVRNDHGMKTEWNATPDAIISSAEKFFPYFERFVWGVSSMAESYVIEGVDFLPAQVSQLSKSYQIRSVFVGCSEMTLERFDQFPGHSAGYAFLPEERKRQIVQDVPLWSEFIKQEAGRFGIPYIDMSGDFSWRLQEAEGMLTTDVK